MKKFMLILLLSLLLSLSVVCASDNFVFDESINCIDNDIDGFESNSLHDTFNYSGNDEMIVDDFVDDIPDSYIVFDECDEISDDYYDDLLDDEIDSSNINMPSIITGGDLLPAGIQTNTDSSDTKYITVHNYNELITAFENLDDNYNNAVITLSGSNEYVITSPLVYGTSQSIKNVTIQGNNHVIDGGNINSFLEIKKDYTVKLYNLTIQNAISDSNGGAIKNSGRLNIYNSCLRNNAATISGGAIFNEGYLYIKNSQITYNQASYGGAIRNSGRVTLMRNSISHNSATNGNGGVIHSKGIILSYKNSIKFNQALSGNGAYAYLQKNKLTIFNDSIYNNTAYYGGVILNNATVLIKYSSINNNIAQNNGGVIYNLENTKCILNNSRFYNNTAQNGGVIVNYGNMNSTNNTYFNNSAYSCGIFNNHGLLNISKDTFKNNYANYTGVLHNSNYTFINSSLFENNSAKVFAGVIYNEGIINSKNTDYIKNYAAGFAGVTFNRGLFNARNNTFENNMAYLQAGSIANKNTTIVTDSIMNNNTANDLGGFIYNIADMTLTNNTFHENLAGQAASIYSTSGTSIILDNTFSNNYSPISASAIQISNESNDTIRGNVFCCNNAEVGGAVYINDSRVSLENNTFANNGHNNPVRLIQTVTYNYTTDNTTLLGACLYVNNSIIEINNDVYSSNTASVHASSIYAKESIILINNTQFSDNNVSTGVGGAIYSDNSTIFIYNSTLQNNTALIGGAITQTGHKDLTIKNTTLYENTATQCGGALYSINSPIILINNTIKQNCAVNASAISILSCPLGSIQYNVFSNNNPTGTSSIYLYESNLLIEHNSFLYDNLIFDDMGSYSIESNYWNDNQPDFHIRTKDITPNTITITNTSDDYRIFLTTPNVISNNNTIPISIKVYNQLNESITRGHIKLEINDTTESILECINNSFTYNITNLAGTVGNIKIKATYIGSDNSETSLNIIKDIKVISSEDIHFVSIPERVKPNEKIQLIIKILKDEKTFINNRKIQACINNTYMGTFKLNNERYVLNYTIPPNYYGLYNLKLVCKDSNLKELKTKNTTLLVVSNNTLLTKKQATTQETSENIILPSSYDIRDVGVAVDYESQGDSGNCWAFSILDCLKYSISKQNNTLVDFSVNNMKNILSKNSIIKSNNTPNNGNTIINAVGYLVSRFGPLYQNKDHYNMYSQLSLIQACDYQVNNVIFVPGRQNITDNDLIKEAIYKYGGVVTTLYVPENINEIAHVYVDELNIPNHAVVVIGWDDNYSKQNFENTPSINGAFLVKDSIKNDTYYVSYADVNFGGLYTTQNNNTQKEGLYVNSIAFPINTEEYDNVYQHAVLAYDGYATLNSVDLWINNTYTITDKQYITAVGTYVLNKSNYTIKIYKNNHLEYTQNGNTTTTGYTTIALNSIISVDEYDQINVVIKLTSLDSNKTCYMMEKAYKTYNTSSNASYISSDGENWINLHDYPQFTDNYIHTASLKLYTNNTITEDYQINITPTTHNYTTTNTYTINITNNHNPVTNTFFNIKLDETLYPVTSNDDGLITLPPNDLTVGKHYMEITNGDLDINFTTSIQVLNNTQYEINSTVYVDLLNTSWTRGMENKIRVHVYHDDGVRVSTGKVVIRFNGKTLKDENGKVIYASVANGEAIFNYTVNSSHNLGNYPVEVIYLSSKGNVEVDYNVSIIRKNISITINELRAFYNESLYVNASIKTSDDTAIDGDLVAFKVNGITIATQNVNNGNVILNQTIPLEWNPGEYDLEVVIGQTNMHNSIRYKTILSIYNNTYTDNHLTYSYYYPVFGEYEYTMDGVVGIDVLGVDLSGVDKINLMLSVPADYTVYYTTDGQQPTTNSTSFTGSTNTNLRLYSTSDKIINNDHTTFQSFKSFILKYYYVHEDITSNVYYYQVNDTFTTMDDYAVGYLATVHVEPTGDDRTGEIYTILTSNLDATYNLTINANKTGTIQYKINNNTTQTYTLQTTIKLNENDAIEITLTTTNGQTTTKELTINNTDRPLVVVKPITSYMEGYQNVTFVCDDEDTIIYYTRDGSDPFNTTNLRQANTSTILTLNNLTQLKYYGMNRNNQTSQIQLYRTPRNEISPVNLSIKKEKSQYNTYKVMLQTNNNHTIYYTIDGTIATTNSHKYNYKKITLHNKTVLNILLVDQNNYKHHYNYTIDNNLTEYIPINYTIELANYHNITLPQVTRYNNSLDDYIIQEGQNGTVMLPFIRTVNINIANQTYKFTNSQIDNTYNIQANDYLLTFTGQITITNHNKAPKKEGILIYTKNHTTIIEYHDKTTQNINQFSVEYTTRYNYNTTHILLVDCIDFNKNNQYKAMIETNTLPLERLTNTQSDIAIRYQLAKQNQYTGDIQTSTYKQITNNNTPPIKYTINNKNIFTINEEPVFDNFIYNPNTIKTRVTINDKNTNRTFTLSHKDYENILSIQQTHNQTLTQLQNITYKYTGAIETYTITNKTTNVNDIEDALNTNYSISIQNTYLASLFVTYFFDSIANEYQDYYNVTYNRTSTITTVCYVNASKIIIHSFNPDMGIQTQGERINKWLYRFTTTSILNVIEADVINILRNKTGPDKTKSTLEEITESINNNQVLTGRINQYYFIIDPIKNISICLNLNTGQLIDNSKIDNTLLHSSQRECPSCEFVNEINQEMYEMWGNESQIPIINNILGEIYQPGYNHELFSCFYDKYKDEYNVLKSIYGKIDEYNLDKFSLVLPYKMLPFVLIYESVTTVTDHWIKIDNQDKMKDGEVTSNNMEYYAITDGYLTLSMNEYDRYRNITYNNPQELHDNHKVIVIKIDRWGSLDYSNMVVYDNTGKRKLTEDEFNYYNGKYDSVLDYYMGGLI